MRSTVTLADIAARTGVSPMTVSCALRGVGRASAQTRRNVLDAARALDYRPNGAAQATATGRFGCVTLLMSTEGPRSTLPADMLHGIHDELARRDMHLATAILPDEQMVTDGAVPRILRKWMSDGLLINYTDHIPAELNHVLESHRIPAIWLNTRRQANCIHFDDETAAHDATAHLLSLGHRRIGYVQTTVLGSVGSAHHSVRDRAAGYARAMVDAGLRPRMVTRASVGESRTDILEPLFDGPDRVTALLTYGQMEAHAAAFVALGRGLHVPRDLSLLTFDYRLTPYLGFHLGAALLPEREAGIEATRMLLELIQHPDRAQPARAVRFSFDAGGSCAPPS